MYTREYVPLFHDFSSEYDFETRKGPVLKSVDLLPKGTAGREGRGVSLCSSFSSWGSPSRRPIARKSRTPNTFKDILPFAKEYAKEYAKKYAKKITKGIAKGIAKKYAKAYLGRSPRISASRSRLTLVRDLSQQTKWPLRSIDRETC